MNLGGKLVLNIFRIINLIIILCSFIFVIWNLIFAFVANANSWKEQLASAIGLSADLLDTIIVLATLLLSLFSGLAAFGMESASYVNEWDLPMFKLCCCSIMRCKMYVYATVVFIFGLVSLVGTGLLHTDVIKPDWHTLFKLMNLESCSTWGELIKPLQKTEKCCGLSFTDVSNFTSVQKDALNPPSCGQWVNNQPIDCGCSDLSDPSCITLQDAKSRYGCDGAVLGPGQVGIYTEGCTNVVIETLNGDNGSVIFKDVQLNIFIFPKNTEISSFFPIFYIGYVIGALMLINFVCSIMIIIAGRKNTKIDSASKLE